MMASSRRGVLRALSASALLGALPALARDTAVAATRHGPVRGYRDAGVCVFKGIRYGADTAPRRFMAPLPPQPWTEVRDALAPGPASPQSGAAEATSEDCLFLNVWTPALRDDARRPVMLYIHGGAYQHGSGSHPLYDGSTLCRRGDVVVVSVNHRLNAFGYAYLARLGGTAFADSGNAGQLDLVLALQWVRDNIAEFGGDAARVMLFGQSGGGAKIATLMAMPAAQGLFHRAATMSGQQVTASGPLNATRRARAWLAALGLKPEQAGALRTLPAEQLVAALKTPDPVLDGGNLYFGPVLDERALSRHPFYPDAPPQSAGIPMIIGNTLGETRNLIGNGDPGAFSLGWDELPARLAPQLRVDIVPELVVAEYRRLYPQYTPSEIFFAATTASRSWRAAVIEAELRAQQGAPAWVYQLDWSTPKDGGKWGAPHGLDIPLVFGTTAHAEAISGDGPQARALSAQIGAAFVAFAHSGNPNCAAIPQWHAYELPRRQTLLLNVTSKLVDDPRGAERRLFAKVPFVQQGT